MVEILLTCSLVMNIWCIWHLFAFVKQINKNFNVCAARIASLEISTDKLLNKQTADNYFNLGDNNNE